MAIGIFLIFVSGALAFSEFHTAKQFCESVDGNYSIKFFPLPYHHLCNDKELIKYDNEWDFKIPNLNYSS